MPEPSPAGTSSKGAAKGPYEFRFVEMGEPSGGCDKDSRSIVRAHVMRDSYTRRKQRTHRDSLPELIAAPPKCEDSPQRNFRFKLGPQGLEEVKKRRRRTKNVPHNNRVPAPEASQKQVSALHQSSFSYDGPLPYSTHGDVPRASTNSTKSLISDELSVLLRNHRAPEFTASNALPAVVAGSGVLDPFNTLPTIECPRTEILLYHAHRGVLSSRIMGRLRTEWLRLATQDTAMFHIALSHYAGNYGLTRYENDPMEALRLRMEAMTIMNQRLENVESALTDGSIGTVASLSSYEATNGNTSAFQTHMVGLKELVRLRGGLQAHGMNKFTKRLILWADLNCANSLGGLPEFDVSEYTDLLSPTPLTTPEEDQLEFQLQWKPKSNLLQDLQLLDESLLGLFIDVRDLAELDLDQPKSHKDMNAIQDSDRLLLTEFKLVALSRSPASSKLVASTCMAAIMFVDKHLRGINFNARIMDRFVARLQASMNEALDTISPFDIDVEMARIVLWILYVGGTAATQKPERAWFVAHLSCFCSSMHINTWEDAKQILESFLWPSDWEKCGCCLWEEVDKDRAAMDQLLAAGDRRDDLGSVLNKT